MLQVLTLMFPVVPYAHAFATQASEDEESPKRISGEPSIAVLNKQYPGIAT